MAFDPTLEEQQLLADTLGRNRSAMGARERHVETLVAVAFVVAAASLWVLRPPATFQPLPALLCLATFVVATLVRFDTPFGFTVATQLAFVPLLFSMPLPTVPVAVVGGLAASRLPDLFRGRMRPARMLQTIGNASFALGPVAVFALANVDPRDAGGSLLVAALIAQFAVDFGVSTIRYGVARGAHLASQLREQAWVFAIDAGLSAVGLVVAEDLRTAPAAVLALLPLLGLLMLFASERQHRMRSLVELNNAYRGTALVLGDVVEADDEYTGVHCKGVVELALTVGQSLGLNAEHLRNLEFAALLHDVGKIAIPKEIINKPGKLDPHEWTIIKTHTIEGQRMLDRVGGFMRQVGLIVRSHHERWDGGGYPDGIAGEEIPLESRIIACCDTWNAMRTDRSYRKALSHDVALAELTSNAGSQLDPRVVDAVIKAVGDERPAEAVTRSEPTRSSPALRRPQIAGAQLAVRRATR